MNIFFYRNSILLFGAGVLSASFLLLILTVDNVGAQASPTFKSGTIPTLSMSQRTLTGGDYFFGVFVKKKDGFNTTSAYADAVQASKGPNRALNLNTSAPLEDGVVRFDYTDASGKPQSVTGTDDASYKKVQEVADAYKASLTSAQPQKPQEQQKKEESTECVVIRPGQTEGNFPKSSNPGTEIKKGGGSYNYGERMVSYDAYRGVNVLAEEINGSSESSINQLLRIAAQAGSIEKNLGEQTQTSRSGQSTVVPKRIIAIAPSVEQAQEFVGTLNGNPANPGAAYTVGTGGNAIRLKPGTYHVGVNVGGPGEQVTFDKDCEVMETPKNATTNPFSPESGSNPNFGGNPGPGGPGGLGGLESILPLLMQMVGGGRGQQGGQNPNGSQYPPYNQQQQQQNCIGIVDSPVCGLDKKTYRTACDARNARTSIVGQGECTKPTPTPNIAAISSTIVNQLNASGVPAAILEQVRNTVTSVLGGVLNGGTGINQTIIK